MCGRYSNAPTDEEIAQELKVQATVGEPPRESWNIALTQYRRIVLDRADRPDDIVDGDVSDDA
jgi:putative SOS response-associated peptidase YedK